MSVLVCPYKDIECGQNPKNWCDKCPNIIKVVTVKFGPKAPDDLPNILRDMADSVERGEITAFVGATVCNGNFELHFSASVIEALTLATLLHKRSVDKFEGI